MKKLLIYIYKFFNSQLIKGIIIGVSLCLLIILLIKLKNILSFLSFLLAIIFIFIIGIIVGNFYFTRNSNILKKNLTNSTNNLKREIIKLSEETIDLESKEEKNKKIIAFYKKADFDNLISLFTSTIFGFITRFLSFSALIAVLGSAVSLAIFVATYLQVEKLDQQNDLIQNQNEKIDLQSHLIESQRRTNLYPELTAVLNLIQEEYTQHRNSEDYGMGEFKLSKSLFSRVNFLCASFKPYYYIDGYQKTNDLNRDFEPKLIDYPISPERGQILTALLNADVSLGGAGWENVDFTYSDLRNLNLYDQLSFPEIDLSYSDFRGSTISSVSFYYCRLDEVNFSNCNIDTLNIQNGHSINLNLQNSKFAYLNIKEHLGIKTNYSNVFLEDGEIYHSIDSTSIIDNLTFGDAIKTLDDINNILEYEELVKDYYIENYFYKFKHYFRHTNDSIEVLRITSLPTKIKLSNN